MNEHFFQIFQSLIILIKVYYGSETNKIISLNLFISVDFSKLNGRLSTKYLPLIRISDLDLDRVYTITRIQRLTNEYGPTIVIDLENQHTRYLPKRVVSLLSDKEGQEVHQQIENSITNHTIGYIFTKDRQHQFVPVKK